MSTIQADDFVSPGCQRLCGFNGARGIGDCFLSQWWSSSPCICILQSPAPMSTALTCKIGKRDMWTALCSKRHRVHQNCSAFRASGDFPGLCAGLLSSASGVGNWASKYSSSGRLLFRTQQVSVALLFSVLARGHRHPRRVRDTEHVAEGC